MARKVINFPQAYNGTLFEHADGTPRRSWLWVEWEIPGGIRKLIEDWQGGLLREYPDTTHWGPVAISVDPAVEIDVLTRLHKEAVMLRRYERGHYRDILTPLEHDLMRLERVCLRSRPHFHGRDVYQWIAEQPEVRPHNWGWRMVKDALNTITDVLVAYHDTSLQEKLEATRLEFRQLWEEEKQRLENEQSAEQLQAA